MSKNRWVKCSETFSVALLYIVNNVIKACLYLFIKLRKKILYIIRLHDGKSLLLCCKISESNFLLLVHGAIYSFFVESVIL